MQAHCPVCNASADIIKHFLYECSKANDLWSLLGVEDVITRACHVDHSGPTILEFLLKIPDHEVSVIGQGERRKFNHGEEMQQVDNISF